MSLRSSLGTGEEKRGRSGGGDARSRAGRDERRLDGYDRDGPRRREPDDAIRVDGRDVAISGSADVGAIEQINPSLGEARAVLESVNHAGRSVERVRRDRVVSDTVAEADDGRPAGREVAGRSALEQETIDVGHVTFDWHCHFGGEAPTLATWKLARVPR